MRILGHFSGVISARWSVLTTFVSILGLSMFGNEPKETRMEKPTAAFDPQIFLAKVGAGKTILKFEKNENVFMQGDVADTVYYIQKGKVKLTVISRHDKEAVVGVLGPGQFFGEGCMNGHPMRIATTTAMESCLITAITKQAMKATLHEEPAFSEMFVAYLLSRNSRIEEDLIDQLFNSSERRLARMLLLLAHFGKEGSSQTIECQSGNAGGRDWHYPIACQPLHEQVPKTWPDQLQRPHRSQQCAAGRGPA